MPVNPGVYNGGAPIRGLVSLPATTEMLTVDAAGNMSRQSIPTSSDKLPLSGGTLTGNLTINNASSVLRLNNAGQDWQLRAQYGDLNIEPVGTANSVFVRAGSGQSVTLNVAGVNRISATANGASVTGDIRSDRAGSLSHVSPQNNIVLYGGFTGYGIGFDGNGELGAIVNSVLRSRLGQHLGLGSAGQIRFNSAADTSGSWDTLILRNATGPTLEIRSANGLKVCNADGSDIAQLEAKSILFNSQVRDQYGIGFRSQAGYMTFYGFNTVGSNSPTMSVDTAGVRVVGKTIIGAANYSEAFGGEALKVGGTGIVSAFGTDPAVVQVGSRGDSAPSVNAFLGGYSAAAGNVSTIYYGQNLYYDGTNWVHPYVVGRSSLFYQQNGAFYWNTHAGNASTGVGTERMSLSNSGTLAIGGQCRIQSDAGFASLSPTANRNFLLASGGVQLWNEGSFRSFLDWSTLGTVRFTDGSTGRVGIDVGAITANGAGGQVINIVRAGLTSFGLGDKNGDSFRVYNNNTNTDLLVINATSRAIDCGSITSTGNVFLTGTFPYYGIAPTAWAGDSFYFQAGVDNNAVGSGNFTTFVNGTTRSFSFVSGNPTTTGRRHLTLDAATSDAVFGGAVTIGSNSTIDGTGLATLRSMQFGFIPTTQGATRGALNGASTATYFGSSVPMNVIIGANARADLTINGSTGAITASGVVEVPAGTSSAPGLKVGSSSQTGLHWSTNALNFVVNGAVRAWVDANSVMQMNAAQLQGSGSYIQFFGGAFLYSGVSNTLEQYNGGSLTSAQTYRLYNTRPSSTNFESLQSQWDTNEARIGTNVGSAGGTQRNLVLGHWNSAGTWARRLTCLPDGSNLTLTSDIVTLESIGGGSFVRYGFGSWYASNNAIHLGSSGSRWGTLFSSAINTAGNVTLADASNLILGTTTGTKIGTATTQRIGFFNATPVVQPSAVADATDAASVITQLNALLSRMRDLGLIAV